MEELIEVFNEIDEDDYEEIVIVRKVTNIRQRTNHFNFWDEEEFFKRFRLSKETANLVLDQIKDTIENKTTLNCALSAEDMFFITLRFYASGSFLINVGDHSGVHVSTVSRVVNKVSRAIARLAPKYIHLHSTENELNALKRDFFKKAKFPNCIGALDCTHVKISSPGGNNAETFRNRKGFFSLNVQTVSDASLKIRDIVCRWHGSAHDSHIFHNSNIHARLERGEFGNSVIVADSGYAVKRYLLTPLPNPQTPGEVLYQESHARTRNPVERAYGVWKRRFPVLATGIRLKLDRVESVVVATAVLHNIACERNEQLPNVTEEQNLAVNFVNNVNNNGGQRPIRNVLLNNLRRNQVIQYFQSLIDNRN